MPDGDPNTKIVCEFPATPEQTRFWFLDQLNPDSAANNICVQWELRGSYANASVETALQKIVERHEVFRTRFTDESGQLVQQVLSEVTFGLGLIDVRNLPQAEQDARIAQIAQELSQKPFDLSQPCQFRVTLVQTRADRAALVVVAHHMVFDGYSIRVLGRELGQLVALIEGSKPPELPDLPLQYGDYSLWKEDCRSASTQETTAQFWQEQLGDGTYFEIAPDRPRQSLSKRRGERITLPLGDDFGDRLEQAAQAATVTPFVFGSAVLAAALHRATDEDMIRFGSVYAGRNAVELEDLIGVFINPVVLGVAIPPNPSFQDVLSAAGPSVQAALTHADYPFEDVFRASGQARDPKRTPLVSMFFGLQHAFLEEMDYGPIEIVSIPSCTPEITHDLNFQIIGRSSGWLLMVDYDTERFDQATVRAHVELVQKTFDLAFTAPQARLDTLPFDRPSAGSPQEVPVVVSKPAATTTARPKPQLSFVDGTPTDAEIAPRIERIWCSVLGVPQGAGNGDFFDLGGFSVLALKLLAQINAEFGVRPNIAQFLAAPNLQGVTETVSNLLAKQRAPEQDDLWNVISLAQGDPRYPIIVSINQPFLYNGLARQLSERCDFLNLHLDGAAMSEQSGPPPAISVLAGLAADRIAKLAGERDLILLGQCVDGSIALKIAQNLDSRGRRTALLGMIDTWAPFASREASKLLRAKIYVHTRVRRWGHILGLRLRGKISWTDFFERNFLTRKLLIRLGRIEAPTAEELAEWALNAKLVSAISDEAFTPYGGETALFKTQSQTNRANRTLFGWLQVLPADTALLEVPGWHDLALQGAGVERLAEMLRARLDRLPILQDADTNLSIEQR